MADAVARPDWFPDWRNQAVAIIASGPSAKKADFDQLRGFRVIAIKENIELFPAADMVYGCDAPWWKNSLGLPKYQGLKVGYDPVLTCMYPDIRIIGIEKKIDRILTEKPGTVGSGGNSGFQALNLAVQFGASRILLVGFDMHDRSGVHWYGRANGSGRNNPCEYNFRRWRAAFAAAAGDLARLSIETVNASPISDLTCFRKRSISETLQEWRL